MHTATQTNTDATGGENRNNVLCYFTGNLGLGNLEAALVAIADEPWRDWDGEL